MRCLFLKFLMIRTLGFVIVTLFGILQQWFSVISPVYLTNDRRGSLYTRQLAV